MRNRTTVEHSGIVESLDNDRVRVGFVSHAACSSCHARGACSLSEVENKFVEVTDPEQAFQPGEKVMILLEQQMGFKALWYGYVFPLVIMLTALILVYALTARDGLAGLVALATLVPYYLLLFVFRSALRKKFAFRLKKLQ